MTGYVVYGSVPWDSPWLNEQNLAHALAREAPVLYVEPELSVLAPFRMASRARPAEGLVRLVRRRPECHDGVRVLAPVAVPRAHDFARPLPLARWANPPLMRRQVARAAARSGLRRPAAISMRSIADLAGACGESALVYFVNDWMQAGGHLVGQDAGALAAEQARMCELADLVCAPSERIRSSLAARDTRCARLDHGFHADLTHLYDASQAPHELAQLPRPLLGYAGRIDARLDFDLLAALADRHHEGSLVLIGPVSPHLDRRELAPLRARPNVHLLGPRSRTELPPMLAALSCSLMPYRPGQWASHGAPMKLWDYLYAGAPIVGMGYESLREHPPPLVSYARDGADFLARVLAALAGGREGREQRRAEALRNSWTQRAARLRALIETVSGAA